MINLNLDRNILNKLQNLKHLKLDAKRKLIDKIPDKYLMKVLATYGSDQEIIEVFEESHKLANNIELCKSLDDNPKKVQKKNYIRAKHLVNLLFKKRKQHLIKREILETYV
jgi:ABC-type tungstate transport system permease subunit